MRFINEWKLALPQLIQNSKSVRPWQRHSLVLLVAGLAYIAIGGAYIFPPITETRQVALEFAANWFPLKVWGMVFVMAGVLSVISSRWPPYSKTWGYTVLSGLSAGWAAFYAAGVLFGDAPTTNFSSTLVWGLIAFMWWAISGLINPDDVVV
jgi:hypothetical protein